MPYSVLQPRKASSPKLGTPEASESQAAEFALRQQGLAQQGEAWFQGEKGVSENRGTSFWGTYNKDPTI